ncbi:low temperature requirement protein A [Solihabitans fulvus]|uniref:Low temperature requirement protein A n=1 Tax=Solihabitans fulvus TaxID=1892852 RepID=A0A5B2XEV9_9PSEU|nr:low temperature requirement protein A [Solihabitans fulvus]KAA2261585.1 low temperature requirement protein A [Solihabitans fulvus]
MTASDPAVPSDEGVGAEQHATWTELFFDLVVVAGVGQLAHVLHEGPSVADLALYALLYFAFWIAWTSFTVYGNVMAEQASTRTMLVGMLGMAVIAASVAGIRETHAAVFIVGYVLLRWVAGRVWRDGTVVVDWPLAQVGGGTLPWIISLWVHPPARYWLWALGIAVDFLILFTVSGSRQLSEATKQLNQVIKWRRPSPERIPTIEAAHANVAHLAERLGLYVIIVLGEGMILIISGASELTWDRGTVLTALGAFSLLVGVWMLSLTHGFAGVPQLRPDRLPLRHIMLLHAVTTAVVAALAAGLGAAVHQSHDVLQPGARWLLCGAIMAYFGICVIGSVATGRVSRRLLGWALPCFAVPLALGLFGERVGIAGLVWAVTATVFWQVYCSGGLSRPRRRRRLG